MFKRLYRYFGSIVMSNVCEKVILEKRKLNRQTVWGMITAMITSFFSRYPICAQWQIFYLCVWSFLNLFYWIYLFSKSINKTLLMGSSFIFFQYVFFKKKVVRPKHFFPYSDNLSATVHEVIFMVNFPLSFFELYLKIS